MIENFITFALRQRVFVVLFALAVGVFGLRALSDLPIEAFPDVQDVQVQVVTQYLGQAPEEVERAVSLPIEREMSGVPRLTQLRSVSMTGLSIVTLIFSDGTNDYFARQQVSTSQRGSCAQQRRDRAAAFRGSQQGTHIQRADATRDVARTRQERAGA